MLTSADVVLHDVLFKCTYPVSRGAFKRLLKVMGGEMYDKCKKLTEMNDLNDVKQRGLPLATRRKNRGKPLLLIIATDNERASAKGEVPANSTEYNKDTLSKGWGKNVEKNRNVIRIANSEDDKIQFQLWITTHMPIKLPKGTFPDDARVVLFSPHEQEVYEADIIWDDVYNRVVLMTDVVDNKRRALLQSHQLVEDLVTKAPRGLFQDIGTWEEPTQQNGERLPTHIVLHTNETVCLHNVRKHSTRIVPQKDTKRKRPSDSTKARKKNTSATQVLQQKDLFDVRPVSPPQIMNVPLPTTSSMQKMLCESGALAEYTHRPRSPATLPQQPVHTVEQIDMPADLLLSPLSQPPSPTLSLLDEEALFEEENTTDDVDENILSLLESIGGDEVNLNDYID